MISNMLRFPLSMFDNDLDDWFFHQPRLARRSARPTYPPVNVGSTDKNVDVYLFVPGMNADELDVVLEKNLLSISGDRKLAERHDKEGEYTRRERFEGKFKRVVTLPEEVNTESAEAEYRDGVLHVSMSRQQEVKPRQIQVSVH